MKRILVIILSLLSMTTAIMADELEDSLYYYFQQFDTAYKTGDLKKACDCHRNVLRIYVQGSQDVSQDTDFAGMLTVYGDLCRETENYKAAINALTESLRIFDTVYGNNHPYAVTSLNSIAWCYYHLGNYNQAIRLGTMAIDRFDHSFSSNSSKYALLLSDLATFHRYLGNYDEAIKLLNEAIEIKKRVSVGEDQDLGNLLTELATCYYSLGNYNEAIRRGTEALEIIKNTLGTNHVGYAVNLSDLASCYSSLGDYNTAIKLRTEAIGVLITIIGKDNTGYSGYYAGYATLLNNMSADYASIGNYYETISLATEATEIIKKYEGDNHPDYAWSLTNLAAHYSELGDCAKAIELTTQALDIYRKTLGEEHPSYAIPLGNLATYYFTLGNHTKAIEFETKAIAIQKTVFGTEHPGYVRSLENLVYFYSDNGNYNKAIPLLTEYVSCARKNVLNTFSGLTFNERFQYWGKYSFALNQWVPEVIIHSGAPNAASVLYDNVALFAKGLLLSTELEMAKLIQEKGDEEAFRMYSELRQNRQILNVQYSKPIAERQINCDSLESVSSALERQLVARVKEFGDYTRNLSITWRDVQNKLGDNDIAIEFLSYCDEDSKTAYVALTLCKGDKDPVLTPLFAEQDLLNASGEDGTYHSFKADSLVWAPLASRLEGKSRAYFSASGMLHNIGIEYLPSMEGKECYRLSSTRELVTKDKETKMTTATIYGGLDYDASSRELMEANHGFAIPPSHSINSNMTVHRSLEGSSLRAGCGRLEGSLRESEFISKTLKEKGIITFEYHDSRGTEESFKALSGHSTSLLHIGTHGFYWTPEEAEQQKQMSDNLRFLGDNERKAPVEDKALSRSGLMMAGCNRVFNNETLPDSLDDGVLTAKEISQLDLRGLHLVVLSACETALGDISGSEGVFGLQRAFKKAGAQSIMMSLWKVDDLVTENMMKSFYTHLAQGESIRQSFAAAQQELRAIDPDPRHWAAFILMDALD